MSNPPDKRPERDPSDRTLRDVLAGLGIAGAIVLVAVLLIVAVILVGVFLIFLTCSGH